jgi:hypothetical protein
MKQNQPDPGDATGQEQDADERSLLAQRPLEIAAAIGALLVLGILFAGFD